MKATAGPGARGYALGLKVLEVGEDLLHAAIGLILFALAGVVLVRSVRDLVITHPLFPQGAINGINDVLFVVIILEVLRTVTSHFTDRGFQLQPFLAIGIISAVRHILTISASLTLQGEGSESHFVHAIIELGVNGALVLALVGGLILLRRNLLEEQQP